MILEDNTFALTFSSFQGNGYKLFFLIEQKLSENGIVWTESYGSRALDTCQTDKHVSDPIKLSEVFDNIVAS